MELKTVIISLTNEISMLFVYVPDGYDLSRYSIEVLEIQKIGRLNSFNRLKILKPWKKDNNLVQLFKIALKREGWNFDKFPNPIAFLIK